MLMVFQTYQENLTPNIRIKVHVIVKFLFRQNGLSFYGLYHISRMPSPYKAYSNQNFVSVSNRATQDYFRCMSTHPPDIPIPLFPASAIPAFPSPSFHIKSSNYLLTLHAVGLYFVLSQVRFKGHCR